MIDYRPKTGDTNNRRNVFFSCHPDDMRFFDEIYEEIEAIKKCKIYFEKDYSQETDLDDLCLKLSAMNLVVVPVTKKLLTQNCRSMETEIPYAMEHNIPILPLIQEDGLEEFFNEKFGNIHTLNKHKQDNPAISYEEQLRKYINAVLRPYGRNVFFSCHPDDMRFCDEIHDEIEAIENCNFYFDKDYSHETDLINLYLVIEDMNLVVVPITSNLLTKKCRAMEIEIPYAKEHNIPILPLMQENGLENDFNTNPVFKSMHTLNKHKQDNLAIPYEEQLRKYINTVLVSDEQINEIKDAFYARIFLSYRKKDIRYAQELMNLIHSEPTFRDIAIWYDNFLTPGEDYNINIKKEIDNSDLFTLVVTSSLNELTADGKKNYVCEHEYPYALKKSKNEHYPILPVQMKEMSEDDTRELKFNFDDIPEPIDAETKALHEFIEQQLTHKISHKNENNPRHYYLIGMAYLNGVDVERNDEIALELIQKSLETSELVVSENGTIKGRRELSTSYDRIGDIYKAQGKLPQALEYYQKSLEIREHLVSETDTIQSRRDLRISYDKIGDLYEAQGNLLHALEYYKKKLELDEQLVSETGMVKSRRDLSVSYNNIGDIYNTQGDLAQALEYYKKSLEIFEQLVSETGTVESRRDLSISYGIIGDIYKAQGNLPQALEYYKKSLEIREPLVSETGTVQSRRDLSVSYNKIGDIYEAQGNLPQALEYYKKSLELRDRLASETGMVNSQKDVRISYERMGDIYSTQGNIPQALEFYKRSLEIAEQHVKEIGTVQSRRDLSISYEKIGDTYKAQGNLPQAQEFYKRSLEISEQLVKETGTVQSYDDLAESYFKMATVTTGDEQQRYFRLAYDIYCRLAEACPDVELFRIRRDDLKRRIHD